MQAEQTTAMLAAFALPRRSPRVSGSIPEMWMPFGLRSSACWKAARWVSGVAAPEISLKVQPRTAAPAAMPSSRVLFSAPPLDRPTMNFVGSVFGETLSGVVMLMLVGVLEYCLTIALAAATPLSAAGADAVAAGARALARTTDAEAVMATARMDLRMDLSSSRGVLTNPSGVKVHERPMDGK